MGKTVKTKWNIDESRKRAVSTVLFLISYDFAINFFTFRISHIFYIGSENYKLEGGELELICLHGGLRFLHIGRMAENFRADFELFIEKKKISFPFK